MGLQEKISIRPFQEKDALPVSALIKETLFTVNNKDYPRGELEEIAERYSPDHLVKFARSKTIFVATVERRPVGTASIEHDYISCVFVAPSYIGKGVGRKLMDAVEDDAVQRGIRRVRLDSSVTARRFYEQRGYEADVVQLGTIAMHKDLI